MNFLFYFPCHPPFKAVLCAVKADRAQGGATTNHVQREISISMAIKYIVSWSQTQPG